MRVSARLLAAGGTALALGALFLAAGNPGSAAGDSPLVWKPVIPAADADDLVKYLGELTLKSLDKGPPSGGEAKQDWTDRLRGTGLLIAAVTASAKRGEADHHLDAARAAALRLSKAIEKGDVAAAKTDAAALASLKATAPGGTTSFGPTEPDLGDAMNLLKLRSKGGLGFGLKPPSGADGIEAKLISLSKRPLPAPQMAKQADDLARTGYILAALSAICDGHPPKKKGTTGKGDRAWAGWTEEMRAAALELADAAKKKDSAGVKKAVNQLNKTCTNCHDEFRP
jgi:hypothetical protein